MKSCRNCAHSRHGGGLRVDLVCTTFGKQVAPHPSMSTEDSLKVDQQCRDLAARCHAYTPEGETK